MSNKIADKNSRLLLSGYYINQQEHGRLCTKISSKLDISSS